eukprot:TRINITY_DN11870_c0_g1::TRINITY_DN11870_c0_g1_i1::g.16511::m.16511 TRINITY_DN11870_c0_g1::TRINITY_DN11870_c0_g1_i1::g.16511  ORF type:complete len:323 (+),score=-5.98,sp/Q5U2Q4/PAR16_RAT/30.21/3e-27,PARP/PF00644.15/5e-10 TRINITY_DN11870_c0_g1_i1:93-1061(+)
MEPLAENVSRQLEECPEGVDLLLSAFSAALLSYRRGTVLDPLPSFYKDRLKTGQEPDYDYLRGLLKEISCVSEQKSKVRLLSHDALQLLSWLSRLPKVKIMTLPPMEMLKKASPEYLAKGFQTAMLPAYAFQFLQLGGGTDFEELAEEYGVTVAFHGSKPENWYPILHQGLKNLSGTPLQRTAAAYGDGIYLSEDLSVALGFSPQFAMWDKSALGDTIALVAVCEVINHPDVHSGRKGDSPETYLIVPSSQFVRITGVLVYATTKKQNTETVVLASGSRFWTHTRQFLKRYAFLIIISSYVFVLLVASSSKSSARTSHYFKY